MFKFLFIPKYFILSNEKVFIENIKKNVYNNYKDLKRSEYKKIEYEKD